MSPSPSKWLCIAAVTASGGSDPEGTGSHPDITAQVWAVDLTGSAEPRP